ncbi:MAG: cell division protein ZapA [Burkholderiaceae bacterium]|jgi:cell division protein ZapA|nr:cell division protein ZapA [Burkholderiaceae bacterium]
MKHIHAQIMGQNYTLGCPDEGEAQLLQAVKRVDLAMCKIRDAGKIKTRDRIAVLAALNLAFDLGQLEQARQAQQAAAAASPSMDPSVSVPATDAAVDAGADSTRMAQLLERLDQALAGDDHLL